MYSCPTASFAIQPGVIVPCDRLLQWAHSLIFCSFLYLRSRIWIRQHFFATWSRSHARIEGEPQNENGKKARTALSFTSSGKNLLQLKSKIRMSTILIEVKLVLSKFLKWQFLISVKHNERIVYFLKLSNDIQQFYLRLKWFPFSVYFLITVLFLEVISIFWTGSQISLRSHDVSFKN